MNIPIGILASHGGSTAQAIIEGCGNGKIPGHVSIVISNNREAKVLDRARASGVDALHLGRATHPVPEELDGAIVAQRGHGPAWRTAEALGDRVRVAERDLLVDTLRKWALGQLAGTGQPRYFEVRQSAVDLRSHSGVLMEQGPAAVRGRDVAVPHVAVHHAQPLDMRFCRCRPRCWYSPILDGGELTWPSNPDDHAAGGAGRSRSHRAYRLGAARVEPRPALMRTPGARWDWRSVGRHEAGAVLRVRCRSSTNSVS